MPKRRVTRDIMCMIDPRLLPLDGFVDTRMYYKEGYIESRRPYGPSQQPCRRFPASTAVLSILAPRFLWLTPIVLNRQSRSDKTDLVRRPWGRRRTSTWTCPRLPGCHISQ